MPALSIEALYIDPKANILLDRITMKPGSIRSAVALRTLPRTAVGPKELTIRERSAFLEVAVARGMTGQGRFPNDSSELDSLMPCSGKKVERRKVRCGVLSKAVTQAYSLESLCRVSEGVLSSGSIVTYTAVIEKSLRRYRMTRG